MSHKHVQRVHKAWHGAAADWRDAILIYNFYVGALPHLQEVHDGLVQAQAQRQQRGAQPQLLACRAAARPHRIQLHLGLGLGFSTLLSDKANKTTGGREGRMPLQVADTGRHVLT